MELLPDFSLCGDKPAVITGISPESAGKCNFEFVWKNSAGNVVGNTNQISISEEGFYYLTFYINNGSAGADCQVNGRTYVGPEIDFQLIVPKEFIIHPSVLEVPIQLNGMALCPEADFSMLSISSDWQHAATIEWVYHDLENKRVDLREYKNYKSIEISKQGTYEVVLFNKTVGELGRDLILMMNSLDMDIPKVPPELPILFWEGKSQGQWVPAGIYIVVITVRNPDIGLE